MSILARDWAYSQALAAPAKPVLVALAEHVSGEGRACWPSVSRLARMTGYAERTVRRALRALEAA
ncbi:helix-turn-helix domain-containing protein, partial [Thiolapillus sp.]